MKKKFLVYIFLSLVCETWAQTPSDASYRIPVPLKNESVSVHLNTKFFLSGETLLFNVYCLESGSGELSALSSVAYVELIGFDKKPLTQIKIKLKDGVGSGDYFFGANVPSGNYTLIAYTKWMRNFNHEHFFSANITVFNPQVPPDNFDTTGVHQDGLEKDSIMAGGVSLEMEKNAYRHREMVTVKLSTGSPKSGMLSLNVRLEERAAVPVSPWMFSEEDVLPGISVVKYLPDMWGELVTGSVTSKSNGRPLAGGLISLSSPSKHFVFRTSTTDSAGKFYFDGTDLSSGQFVLKSFRHSEGVDYKIDDPFLGDYGMFQPPKLVLTESVQQLIDRRHLSVQVENAFYPVKKDSVVSNLKKHKFFVNPDKVYRLDDFMRFSTLEDVFREIIGEVVVKIREGNYSLLMMNSVSGYRFQNSPLVLIDGIPVSDANVVMKYDPLLISSISLVTKRYYYGGLETEGIISIETYDGVAKNLNIDGLARRDHLPLQPSKFYYSPVYGGGKDLSRIPDFRLQLFWKPDIRIENGETKTFTFFTGDLDGEYFVEVVGVSSDGEPVYWIEKFSVKQ